MRSERILALLLALAVATVGPTLKAQDRSPAEVRLQAALNAEEVEGNLTRAIELYNDVVRRYGRERDVAARALFYLGRTYEKQGSQEATRAYQRVVREYGDQSEMAAQARTRLAALQAAAPTVAGRGPVARRVLSAEETDMNDFTEMSPSLDGRRVAYVNMSEGGLYVRDLASGDVQRLAVGLPAAWHSFPKWSPDGRRLAVATTDLATRVTSIELIDAATHAAVAVPGSPTQGRSSINPAEWSRDGRFLLCVREKHLVLIALDGGTMTTLADSVRERHGSLSPDGRFVAYAVGPDGNSRAFVRPVAGGPPQPMTAPQGSASNPVWSPDGRAIAYEFGDGIWVMPVTEGAPSGAPRPALVTGTISLRGWTETGLYYTSWGSSVTAPYQIQVDPATGGSAGAVPQSLPGRHPERFESFTWSPDMQRVAFAHFNPAAVSVYSANRGTVERFDLSGLGYVSLPSWSADGREVLVHVFTPQLPPTDTMRAVDPATGRVRVFEPRIAGGIGASYSADGRTVAFVRLVVSGATWQAGEIVVAAVGASDGQVVATAGGAGGASSRLTPLALLSPRGDKVAYVRQAPGQWTLWVVGSDGSGTRQLATAARITRAVWDPSGRFIAYTATESTADSARSVLRVVEVGTGVDQQIPLPATFPRRVAVTDWSRDGRLLGLVATLESRWEYWVAQGLLEGGR
jgi:Tol biopolymer transport system component